LDFWLPAPEESPSLALDLTVAGSRIWKFRAGVRRCIKGAVGDLLALRAGQK
jgi:hypothetical protein